MGVVTRKRPRRLVLAAAVIALAAALFVAIQAPLQAQSEPRITIKVDGKNHLVTASQLEAAQDEDPPFTQERRDGRRVPVTFAGRGTSLDALLSAARPRIPARTKLIELTRSNRTTLFASRSSNIVFFFDRSTNRFAWVEDGGPTTNRQVTPTMTLRGRAGNVLDVDITADPEKPREDEEVTFTADVEDGLEEEEFTYDWNFGDGDSDRDGGESVTHTYGSRDRFTVTVTVKGDQGSRGVGEFTFRAGKKPKPPSNSGGSGSGGSGSGGSGSGGSGSGGSGGGFTPDPGGGLPPAGTTPPPTTPSLPPPSTSPPSDPGRGPNLDPTAPPSADIPTGQEVQGILVSTGTPPRPGQPASKAPNAQAKETKPEDESFDWALAGGIALTALLVILGAVRERVRLQRLLPKPQPQPQSG